MEVTSMQKALCQSKNGRIALVYDTREYLLGIDIHNFKEGRNPGILISVGFLCLQLIICIPRKEKDKDA